MTFDAAQTARVREAVARLAADSLPRAECADPEVILSAVLGERDPAEVERLADHAAGCPSCWQAWSAARALDSESTETEASRAWKVWVPLLAAAVLVVVALLPLPRRAGEPPAPAESAPVFRSDESARIESLLDAKRPLPRSACVLRWTPDPVAVRYEVYVTDEALAVLATARHLEQPEFEIPSARLAAVPAGGTIVWRVVARRADGSRITSASFRNGLE